MFCCICWFKLARGGGARNAVNAGCTSRSSAPTQGDVRLATLAGTVATSPCDDVHFGGVEIFNDGAWGRICFGTFDQFQAFTVDAQVVCRQLGFPFGSLNDVFGAEDVRDFTDRGRGVTYEDYRLEEKGSSPSKLVWATDVVCTGTEERLDECFFPEEFGANPRTFHQTVDVGADVDQLGLTRTSCNFKDSKVFSVICRRFELSGASGPSVSILALNILPA